MVEAQKTSPFDIQEKQAATAISPAQQDSIQRLSSTWNMPKALHNGDVFGISKANPSNVVRVDQSGQVTYYDTTKEEDKKRLERDFGASFENFIRWFQEQIMTAFFKPSGSSTDKTMKQVMERTEDEKRKRRSEDEKKKALSKTPKAKTSMEEKSEEAS